jgi:ferric-dicitrate binding protein FerR (iron transport regulator)
VYYQWKTAMKTNDTYYIDLIARYFYGEATMEEIGLLEAWVKSDPVNAALFSEYQKTWKTVENSRIGSSIDLDHEWNTLGSKLGIKEYESKSKILYYALRIAAISLLLLVPAYFLYHHFTSPAEQQLAAGNEIIERTLPDGTVVTLNAGATLTFNPRFDGSIRRVALTGEAWFEVARDKCKPFIIAAENVRIRVIGTSFFVNTKSSNDTKEIILSSGIVRVYYENKPQTMALLYPGEKAELLSNGYQIIRTTNEDVNFLSWKTKHMVFDNTPLKEVVALLTKVYHSKISLSDAQLSDCRITTTFDGQSLESVLNVLKATLDLQARDTGSGFELSGSVCKQSL